MKITEYQYATELWKHTKRVAVIVVLASVVLLSNGCVTDLAFQGAGQLMYDATQDKQMEWEKEVE